MMDTTLKVNFYVLISQENNLSIDGIIDKKIKNIPF